MIYPFRTLVALVLWSPFHFISATTTPLDVVVTTLAGKAGIIGSTNGFGTNARFYDPSGLSISSDSLYALVADFDNHLIRKIILSTAYVTTIAGVEGSSNSTNGIGTNSYFSSPSGINISPDRSFALIADCNNHLIRHIILSTLSVTTFAGLAGSSGSTNGIGTNAKFQLPIEISISPDALFALVADTRNSLIRHIIISTGTVSTLAGVARSYGSTDGIGTNSKFNNPYKVGIAPNGLFALVADTNNYLIRHIVISTAIVTTLAGYPFSDGSDDGIGTNARFDTPFGVSISPDNTIALITDSNNNLIRHLVISTRLVTTVAGEAGIIGSTDGVGTNSKFSYPIGVYLSSDGSFALVVDLNNHLIRKIDNILESSSPTTFPSSLPSISNSPTKIPTHSPTNAPTISATPTIFPTISPTFVPSISLSPTLTPSSTPSCVPSVSLSPTRVPTNSPTLFQSFSPTNTVSYQGHKNSINSKIIYISVAVGGFIFMVLLLFIIIFFFQKSNPRELIPRDEIDENGFTLQKIESSPSHPL
jgi:hypothetical protein